MYIWTRLCIMGTRRAPMSCGQEWVLSHQILQILSYESMHFSRTQNILIPRAPTSCGQEWALCDDDSKWRTEQMCHESNESPQYHELIEFSILWVLTSCGQARVLCEMWLTKFWETNWINVSQDQWMISISRISWNFNSMGSDVVWVSMSTMWNVAFMCHDSFICAMTRSYSPCQIRMCFAFSGHTLCVQAGTSTLWHVAFICAMTQIYISWLMYMHHDSSHMVCLLVSHDRWAAVIFRFARFFGYFKVGLGISRTNADSQWNPVYNAFHRNFCGGNETIRFVVETKRFVGSFVHVILTLQTCGQRSSMSAESKRRALGNCFSERICYMFLISKCRGDLDLGLCTTSGLVFGEPQRNGKIRFFLRQNTFFFPEVATMYICIYIYI